jgi:hypothetical protein
VTKEEGERQEAKLAAQEALEVQRRRDRALEKGETQEIQIPGVSRINPERSDGEGEECDSMCVKPVPEPSQGSVP